MKRKVSPTRNKRGLSDSFSNLTGPENYNDRKRHNSERYQAKLQHKSERKKRNDGLYQ